ncbi:MAG: hypothetical protein AB2A00_39225 [Myxococcota bacterium]
MRASFRVPALLLALTAAACPNLCQPAPPEQPVDVFCRAFSGEISGDPVAEIGTGASEFVPVAEGGRWQAGSGTQGGQHLWLSVRTEGLGPQVKVSYRTLELDGGVINAGFPVSRCLNGRENDQVVVGLTAFLEGPPDYCSRELCGGPFAFEVDVTDNKGHRASDRRSVSGVDFSGGTPPECDGGPSAQAICEGTFVGDAGSDDGGF